MTHAPKPIEQLDSATEAVDEASMHAPYSAMKILFPAGHDGEADIRSGFKSPAHAIASADFTPENLHAHDLAVPLTVSDLRRLDDLRDLVDGNAIPISSLESIAVCDDKLRLNAALIANGFAAASSNSASSRRIRTSSRRASMHRAPQGNFMPCHAYYGLKPWFERL